MEGRLEEKYIEKYTAENKTKHMFEKINIVWFSSRLFLL
jgi:hypothetical protein